MSELTQQETFDLATRHHAAGRLADAEKLYQQVLAQQPENTDALRNLAALAHQQSRNHVAAELLRRVIAINTNLPEAHNILGTVLKSLGRFDEAVDSHRRAVGLRPGYFQAHNNLGVALAESKQFDAALAAFSQAISLRPDFVEAHTNRENALKGQGQFEESINVYQKVIALAPNHSKAQIGRRTPRKRGLFGPPAKILRILKYGPAPPPTVSAPEPFDWCNDLCRSDKPTVVVLVPAIVRDERELEMLRVQSLVAGRLHGVRVLSCVVIDYVSPRWVADVLALDFTMGIFQRSPTTGIRRPMETGIRAIKEVWGPSVSILRVISDTPIYDAGTLSADIRSTIGEPGPWVAGGIEEFLREPTNHNREALDALDIHKDRYEHVHGCLSFAPLETWEKYYCGLHPSITHYADDDVMSSWILRDGGKLIGWQPSWKHEHGQPIGLFSKLLPERLPTAAEKQPITLACKNDEPYVLLFPFAPAQRWDWKNWRTIAESVLPSGRRAIASCWDFDTRLKMAFDGLDVQLALRKPPEQVIGTILNASVVVAADPGMCQVGAVLGVPTVAIGAGGLPHEFPFKNNPMVKMITPTNPSGSSEHPCGLEANLASAVIDAINSFALPHPGTRSSGQGRGI